MSRLAIRPLLPRLRPCVPEQQAFTSHHTHGFPFPPRCALGYTAHLPGEEEAPPPLCCLLRRSRRRLTPFRRREASLGPGKTGSSSFPFPHPRGGLGGSRTGPGVTVRLDSPGVGGSVGGWKGGGAAGKCQPGTSEDPERASCTSLCAGRARRSCVIKLLSSRPVFLYSTRRFPDVLRRKAEREGGRGLAGDAGDVTL